MTVVFMIGTIVFFLGLDWAYRTLVRRNAVQSVPVQHAPLPLSLPRVPDGIFFTHSHTWLSLFPSGKVRCGIDDFVSGLIGETKVTLLQPEGAEVRKGDPIARLQNGDRTLTVFAPIDGDIVGLNSNVVENPALLRQKVFSDGWLCAINPRRPSDLKALLLGSETRAWMQNELRRLRDFLAGAGSENQLVPVMLQDGGMPVAGALRSMDDSAWREFQESFLQPR